MPQDVVLAPHLFVDFDVARSADARLLSSPDIATGSVRNVRSNLPLISVGFNLLEMQSAGFDSQ